MSRCTRQVQVRWGVHGAREEARRPDRGWKAGEVKMVARLRRASAEKPSEQCCKLINSIMIPFHFDIKEALYQLLTEPYMSTRRTYHHSGLWLAIPNDTKTSRTHRHTFNPDPEPPLRQDRTSNQEGWGSTRGPGAGADEHAELLRCNGHLQ